MSELRLMLVRHGETQANVERLLDSRPPGPPLTELGRRQAAELAERLATEPVVAVYASVALRAQQTARPVAERHGLSVEVLDGVHEVQVGDLEGRADEEAVQVFYRVFGQWTAGELEPRLPGGESGVQVRERYLAAVRGIAQRHQDGLVVLVSHGGAIRLAAEWLADNVDRKIANERLIANTGHVLLEANRDPDSPAGWQCLEWDGITLG